MVVVVCMPLIPALKRHKQEDLCELEARLVYRESSRTARVTVPDLFQISSLKNQAWKSLFQALNVNNCQSELLYKAI